MKNLTIVALFALVGSFGAPREAASQPLPRSQPEAQGISSSAVLAFVEDAEKKIDALHSFMLVRHGHVVAEGWWSPYNAEAPTLCIRSQKASHPRPSASPSRMEN